MNKLQFAKLVSFVSTYGNVVMQDDCIAELERLTNIQPEQKPVDLTPLFNALAGDNKIEAIKEYRALTEETLLESKRAVERVMFNRMLADIKSALGTEENGEALVEVARNVHKVEQKLLALQRLVDSQSFTDAQLGQELRLLMKEGAATPLPFHYPH